MGRDPQLLLGLAALLGHAGLEGQVVKIVVLYVVLFGKNGCDCAGVGQF